MSATLRRTPHAARAPALPVPWTGRDRRAPDPLGQLSRRLEGACQGAVQPLELAAILEAEGYTDQLVQARFGTPDVFECAQLLYRRVPFRPPDVTATTLPRPVPLERDLTRGVIYLMPALWTPFALPLTSGAGAAQVTTAGLLTATLFGWGWMQGVAYRGYQALVRGPAPAARTLAALGVQATVLTAALAAGVAWTLGLPPLPTAGVALAMGAYLASATTLLVLGQEAALLLTALPVAALILGHLSGLLLAPQWLTLLLAVGGPLLAAAQAVVRAGRPAIPAASHAGRALLYALYGWLCAAFLAARLLNPWEPGGADLSGMMGLSWSVAPLVLGMGALEFTLRGLHRGLAVCARSSEPVGVIRRRGARLLAGRVALFTAGLGGTYALVALLSPALGGPALAPELLAGHVLLGGALLLSGYLINVGLLGGALLVWTGALVTQVLARETGLAPDPAYLLGAVVAALLCALLSAWAVRDARHLT
ncbi:hypothetical protein [Deinococcus sp. JMULE3]|uniref:hypothetical protein n=1 Tax=Deinococcus sp. JMULE3 TaxID=2518341 RepID=UPI001574EF1F|nr:hypothetical protein [Deinococcus sp. JMULE3]NTX98971.1 hypothetical protein [Deinococcus sp. JMULE3]